MRDQVGGYWGELEELGEGRVVVSEVLDVVGSIEALIMTDGHFPLSFQGDFVGFCSTIDRGIDARLASSSMYLLVS